MRTVFFFILMLLTRDAFTQSVNSWIEKGNDAYRAEHYDKAIAAYRKALTEDPLNDTALFNMGNALFKQKTFQAAADTFERAIGNTADQMLLSRLSYNRGVALTQLQALDESIAAYKQALRFNPADTLARENLQRALNEKRKQQSANQKDKQNQDKPKPQSQKLSKQQVEQLLKSLEEQERKLHDLTKKKMPAPNQPEKDW